MLIEQVVSHLLVHRIKVIDRRHRVKRESDEKLCSNPFCRVDLNLTTALFDEEF